MSSRKKVKMKKDEFISRLKSIYKEAEIKSDILKGTQTNLIISLPGQELVTFALYDSSKGLTINPNVGKNQKLGNQITEAILSKVEKCENKTQTFRGISKTLLNDILTELGNNECEIAVNNGATVDNVNIINENEKVSLSHYPTTNTLVLKGINTFLWDDVFLVIADKTDYDASKIVNLYIKTEEDVTNTVVNYDDGILEKLAEKIIGDCYNNKFIIINKEKNFLKSAIFLLYTQINLPEYSITISSSIKIIEGLLNRILIKNKIPKSGHSFNMFEKSPNSISQYTLKGEFKNNLDGGLIKLIDELYNFLQKQRHPLCHNDGISPRIISEKESALSIFEEIVRLLNEAHVTIGK